MGDQQRKNDGLTQPVRLKPGQFICGRDQLHGEYHQWRKGYKKLLPSPRTLWRWLKVLEKMGFLTIRSTNKFSIITMANWPTEQTEKQKVSSKLTNRRPTDDHRETSSKHSKEREGKPNSKKLKEKKDCEKCGEPFVPDRHYHTQCDYCYKPKKQELSPNYPKCQNPECPAEDTSVMNGFCWKCRAEKEQALH